jgi:hypothetical protein
MLYLDYSRNEGNGSSFMVEGKPIPSVLKNLMKRCTLILKVQTIAEIISFPMVSDQPLLVVWGLG